MGGVTLAKARINKEKYGLLFIAPFFITFLIFQLYPMIYSFYVSFLKWDGMSKNVKFVGTSKLFKIIFRSDFYKDHS